LKAVSRDQFQHEMQDAKMPTNLFYVSCFLFRRKPPQTHVQHPANPGTAPFGPPNTQADTLRQGISKEIARSDRGEGVGSMFDPKFPVGIITLAG